MRTCGHGRLARAVVTRVGCLSKSICNHSGVAAVEFAIVAPIFLLTLAGIVTFGLYFATAATLQHVVNEAARASIAGLDDTERTALARAEANASLDGYRILNRDQVIVDAGPDASRPHTFRVVIRYDTGNLFLMPLTRFTAGNLQWIERSAAVQYGGF